MQKQVILDRISANGTKFDAGNEGYFVCPTCLSKTSLRSASEITKAHIIPRYSGGTLATYLCRRCNSAFGRDQDYWLGEYLYLTDGSKGLLATRKQKPTFRVNGVEVRGKFQEGSDGALEFFIWQNLNSPKTLAALKAAETPGKVELQLTLPVLRETQSIKVGLLTAAYLLWFKELGYSWVFQHHLTAVRSQILNPSSRVLPPNFVLDAGERYFKKPWIGFLELTNDYLPCAGIADRLVLFPSFSTPKIYEKLSRLNATTLSVEYESIRICDYHQFPDPVGLVYRDQAVVFPDLFSRVPQSSRVLYYAGDGRPPHLLHRMDDATYEMHKQHAVITKIRRSDA
jgi:hypothetical protein